MPATFNKVDYIMITVSNMARSVAFYKDKLGIPMKFGTPEWTEFQTGKTYSHFTAAVHPKKPPAIRSAHYAGTCSIGFNVDNLDLVYEQLQAKGVVFVMPPTHARGKGSSSRSPWILMDLGDFVSGRRQRNRTIIPLSARSASAPDASHFLHSQPPSWPR